MFSNIFLFFGGFQIWCFFVEYGDFLVFFLKEEEFENEWRFWWIWQNCWQRERMEGLGCLVCCFVKKTFKNVVWSFVFCSLILVCLWSFCCHFVHFLSDFVRNNQSLQIWAINMPDRILSWQEWVLVFLFPVLFFFWFFLFLGDFFWFFLRIRIFFWEKWIKFVNKIGLFANILKIFEKSTIFFAQTKNGRCSRTTIFWKNQLNFKFVLEQ